MPHQLERQVWIMEGLKQIMLSKGKQYSKVIADKFGGADVSEFMTNLTDDIASTGLGLEVWKAAVSEIRREEFTHTAFSPLPDTSQIVKIVRKVMQEWEQSRPVEEDETDKAQAISIPGGIIGEDGELILRDHYFFRNAARQKLWRRMDPEWIQEAKDLSGIEDDIALEAHFMNLVLPPRISISFEEIMAAKARFMTDNKPWKRYRPSTLNKENS